MSIFELKVLWAAQLGKNEDYDGKHLAVGLLDHELEERIAVASYSGVLKIFRTGIKCSERDVIFETDFGEPIVQVRIGTFIPNVGVSLGVLFIKKLVIMAFAPNQNGDGLISKSLEMVLPSPCFGFLESPLLTTSTNSVLHYLNPPSTLEIKVEQPIYAVTLSEKSHSLYYMDGEELVMVNSSIEQWRVILGEASAIHLHSPSWEDEIVCVGTDTYWVVDESSTIVESKHIENEISCSMIVPAGEGYNLVLGTFSEHVFIYHKSKLIWAAKCHFVPIAIRTAQVAGKKGFLVLLSDNGQLEVCHLGTDIPLRDLAEHSPQIQLKEVDADTARLEGIVDQKGKNPVPDSQADLANDLRVSVLKAKPAWTEEYMENREMVFGIGGRVRVLHVQLSLGTPAAKRRTDGPQSHEYKDLLQPAEQPIYG